MLKLAARLGLGGPEAAECLFDFGCGPGFRQARAAWR
jgi:hypothetical protein